MNVADFRRDTRNAGALGAVVDVGYRLANKLTTLMVLRTLKVTLHLLKPVPQNDSDGFRHLYLDEPRLRMFARDPVNELTDRFLDEALAKGDRCSAILDGERLVNYVWCSRKPTRITANLLFEFGADWLYRYKAFTIPTYRGRRLHGMNTTMSLRETIGLGVEGFLCYADLNNYSSLRSMYRRGYVDVGKMYALKAPGTYWIHVDPRCRSYGLNLRPL